MFTNEFLNSPMGQAAMDYAEQVYASSFKAEEFTLAEHPEMLDELVSYHMEPVYKHEPADPLFRDDDEFFEYIKTSIMKLFPDAAPKKGRWVVIKCDSGPGRLNPDILAYLRYHGFLLYPLPSAHQRRTPQEYSGA